MGAIAATGDRPQPAGAVGTDLGGVVAERPVDDTAHTVNGEVRTVAYTSGRTFAGGTFTQVAPGMRGGAGVADVTSSSFTAGFPDIQGAVHAAARDGSGGWYLVGDFANAGGLPRANVVHVDVANAVTAFVADTNAPVWSVQVGVDGVYLAGAFTNVNGASTGRVAKVDRTTGALLWSGPINATARAILLSDDGTRLYVGGDFTSLNGNTNVKRLASLDAATGAHDTTFVPGPVNLAVRAIDQAGTRLFVGGDFVKVNNIDRKFVAAVDATTGALDPWNPILNGTVADIEISADDATIYLGGAFTTIGGVSRQYIGGVATDSNALRAVTVGNWRPPSMVKAISFDATNSNLEFAGSFRLDPERSAPYHLGRVNISTNAVSFVTSPFATPLALARTPKVSFGIETLVRDGTRLLVGGDFSDYGVIGRNYLIAMDAATKAIDLNFDPVLDGPVFIAKPDGSGNLIIGGDFNTVNGVPSPKLAKLDMNGDLVAGFIGSVGGGYVKDIAVDSVHNKIYLGGNFLTIAGQPRNQIGSVDLTTGAIDVTFDLPITGPTNDLAPTAEVRAMDITPDAATLVVIGNFRYVDGIERPMIAQIDLTGLTAEVNGWTTPFFDVPCSSGRKGWMRDVSISPDGQKMVIVTSGHHYFTACDTAVQFPVAGGAGVAVEWYKKIGDTIEAVAYTTDAVYIGGHFRYLETETDTEDRFQVAALSPLDGSALSWNPTTNGFRGVLTLETTPVGLLAGHDGTLFGGVAHGGYAQFAAPTPGLKVRKYSYPFFVVDPGGPTTHTITLKNTFSDRDINVTTLNDTSLGNLNGVGTCAVPQLLGPGTTYSCSVPEQINGTIEGTVLSSVSTASGTANGATISGSDRSGVEIIDAPSSWLRIRVVGTMTQVPVPGADVQYSITVMNLDLHQPIELSSLTTDLFGDLHGQGNCAAPQTIAPNALYRCDFTAPVIGLFGEQPRVTFTAGGNHNGNPVVAAQSITHNMTAPPNSGDVLLVVPTPAALTPAETAVRSRLIARGYTVTVADDNTVQAANTPGKRLVVLSSSVITSALGTRLRDVQEPVIVFKHSMYDLMRMTGAGAADRGLTTAAQITITQPTHPLAAARSGAITIDATGLNRSTAWGVPATTADVVATVAGNPTIFAYRPQDLLYDGTPAPGCRIGFPGTNPAPSAWSTTMYALFDMATNYAATSCGQTMVSIFGGNGATGTGSDNVPATQSSMNTPSKVVTDAAGNVYYADSGNNKVRRIDAITGNVTTYAGTGTAGYLGNGGPAVAAQMRGPQGLAIASNGDLYIADTNNHVVRKVTAATGVITAVAGTGSSGFTGDGGAATSARLRNPAGISFDANDNLFIADRANNRIRKVTAATGVISTAVGNGGTGYNGDGLDALATTIWEPYAVVPDAAGNLYIADYRNNRIRFVEAASGLVSTIAGTGIAGYNGDGIPAAFADIYQPSDLELSADGTTLVFSDFFNNRIRSIDLTSQVISTIAGAGTGGSSGNGLPGTYALINRTFGVTFAPDGSLLFADRNNRRIRMIGSSIT